MGSSLSSSLLFQAPTQHFFDTSFLSLTPMKFHTLTMPSMPPLNTWLGLWVRVKMGPECSRIVPRQLNYESPLMFHSFMVQSYEADMRISLSVRKARSRMPSWWAWLGFSGPTSLYADDFIVLRALYFYSFWPATFYYILGPSMPRFYRSFSIFSIRFLMPRDCRILSEIDWTC